MQAVDSNGKQKIGNQNFGCGNKKQSLDAFEGLINTSSKATRTRHCTSEPPRANIYTIFFATSGARQRPTKREMPLSKFSVTTQQRTKKLILQSGGRLSAKVSPKSRWLDGHGMEPTLLLWSFTAKDKLGLGPLLVARKQKMSSFFDRFSPLLIRKRVLFG